jgi:hypothetical protein
MKSNIYEHYIKILKFHVEYYYPNFDETEDIDFSKINFVKSSIDEHILKVRLIACNTLSKIDVNSVNYGFLKNSICHYIDKKFYDNLNNELNIELDDNNSKIYDIEHFRLIFLKYLNTRFV